MKILNQTKDVLLADQAKLADSFFRRLIGLLNHSELPDGQALIISRCTQVHMFFMKFPIDVIFVDKNKQVVGMAEHLNPWALSKIYFKAADAIELPAGTIAKTRTELSDRIVYDTNCVS